MLTPRSDSLQLWFALWLVAQVIAAAVATSPLARATVTATSFSGASLSSSVSPSNACPDPCSLTQPWYGISCYGPNVTSISLPSCQLSGKLPSALNELQLLSVLVVDDNNLTATLPELQLPYFFQFSAANNLFTGPIPSLPNSLFLVYLKDNALTGTLPASLGELSSLITFNAADNRLQGSIPPGLMRGPGLRDVDLSRNRLTGPLPSALSPAINNINFRDNALDGTFPPHLCAVPCDLVNVQLAGNKFYGKLPKNFANMSDLSFLDISNSLLTGTLPSGLQALSRLNELILSGNMLSGPLDAAFTPQRISDIQLDRNWFTGPLILPANLNPLVRQLNVSFNQLAGPFLMQAGELGSFSMLDASHNHLTGPLPASLNQSKNLRFLDLSSNLFTSSIPAEVASLRLKLYLDLSDNYLSGGIPEELFDDCIQLPWPTSTASCSLTSTILYLFLHQNFLSSSIPPSIGGARAMRQMFLFDNLLTGQIPLSIRNLTLLSTVLLQRNLLTGQPGVPFGGKGDDRNLTGVNITDTHFRNLQVVDIGDNRFSGTLPVEFFRLPRLSYFAITKGCYDYGGDLPAEICDAEALQTLVLEGLQAGTECNTDLWDPLGLFNQAYVGRSGKAGTIPACLWDMRRLKTLHLAGNMLTGSLPAGPTLPDAFLSLEDISLSFNELTGTISRTLQEHGFSSLDLSRNKLSGTFDHVNVSGFQAAEQRGESYDFHLNINRLSGAVPLGAQHLSHVQILAGNIWSCDSQVELPEHDPQKVQYVCGSRTYDTALLFWGALLGAVALAGAGAFVLMQYYEGGRQSFHSGGSGNISSIWKLTRRLSVSISVRTSLVDGLALGRTSAATSSDGGIGTDIIGAGASSGARGGDGLGMVWLRSVVEQFNTWDSAACHADKLLHPQLCLFLQTLINLRLLAVSLAMLIAALYLPLYLIGKTYFDFGSHTSQYRWLITAAYMSSLEAGAWMAGLFIVVLLCFVVQVYRHYFAMRSFYRYVESCVGEQEGEEQQPQPASSSSSQFSTTPNSNVNSTRGPSAIVKLKKSLIIFALVFFNCVFVLSLKCGFVVLLHIDAVDPSLQTFLQFALAIFDIFWNAIVLSRMVLTFPRLLSPSARIQIRLFGLVFNHILAPIVATSLTDRSCFSELFFARAGNIDTFSSIQVCDTLDDKGLCSSYSPLVLSTSFAPLFSYKYQCSSSVFSVFLPVLLFTYTLTAFVEPLLILLVANFVKFEYLNKSLTLIPSILWPTRSRDDELNKVILPEILASTLLGHVAVILTYGIASPVVAAAVALTVWIYTWQWHYIIGRYLTLFRSSSKESRAAGNTTRKSQLSSDSNCSSESSNVRSREMSQSRSSLSSFVLRRGGNSSSCRERHPALEGACYDAWRGAVKSVWIMVCVATIFLSLLLVDVGGDEVGIILALQLLVAPVLLAALLGLVGLRAFTRHFRRRGLVAGATTAAADEQRQLAKSFVSAGEGAEWSFSSSGSTLTSASVQSPLQQMRESGGKLHVHDEEDDDDMDL